MGAGTGLLGKKGQFTRFQEGMGWNLIWTGGRLLGFTSFYETVPGPSLPPVHPLTYKLREEGSLRGQ